MGLCFGPRSGLEHCCLQDESSQLVLVEYHSVLYLKYQVGVCTERKIKIEVIQYANLDNPDYCIVQLYNLYNEKYSLNHPSDAFYLRPIPNLADSEYWLYIYIYIYIYPCAVGHNILCRANCEMVISGSWHSRSTTNHSLRANAATSLFESKVETQLIM